MIVAAAVVLSGILSAGGLLWYYAQDLPDLGQLQNYQPSLVTQVYSSDKRLIGQFFIERRILTPLPQIPEHLRRAVIAVEDVRFFEHPGLDYIGILRAAWTNLRRGGKVEGASTITSSWPDRYFLSSERTFDRKVRELSAGVQDGAGLQQGTISSRPISTRSISARAPMESPLQRSRISERISQP